MKKTERARLLPSNDLMTALAKQEALASAFQAASKTLHAQPEADPRLMSEAVLTALASIRTWLETSTVRISMRAVQRDQLEEWEDELLRASAYFAGLADIVDTELHMSLRERNRRLVDLA